MRDCFIYLYRNMVEGGGGDGFLLDSYFQHRSARIIAALRLALAVIFFTALVADPGQPYRAPLTAYAVLGSYIAFALVLLRVAWVSWWYDFRLSAAALFIDVTVFSVAVLFTESTSSAFNSPFTAFFFFIMFSASLRWNSRVVALSAIAAAMGYLVAGLALMLVDKDVDMQVFLRRLSYMAVIGLAFVFAGFEARRGRHYRKQSDLVEFDAFEAVLRHATRRLGAEIAVIAWETSDEPPVAALYRNNVVTAHPLDSLAFDENADVILFDSVRGRALYKTPGSERVHALSGPIGTSLAARFGITEGLIAMVRSGQGSLGTIVLSGISTYAVDDLERLRDVASEVVVMIEERALAQYQRNRAVIQTREALARDLHDSVAQALTGASFGIEALRQTIPPDADEPLRLAAELKATLRREQAHIREMIERLRVAPEDKNEADLAQELEGAVEECRQRWGIAVDFSSEGDLHIAAPLAYECRQIVREAVSNAVRHGRARHVSVRAQGCNGRVELDIANDGAPFGPANEDGQPWTIRERVVRLKGHMHVGVGGTGPHLHIQLPLARE